MCIRDSRPATAEYLIRRETTPPMSAGFPFLNCWVDADAMVVSEIGARLSPKIAPDTIHPAIIISFAPSIMPAGEKIGNAINMVPMEEPVAVETMQEAINVNATKMPPFMPTAFAIHTKPVSYTHLIPGTSKSHQWN